MNFQQLKIIKQSARCNFNLTEVSRALYTSQSGISRHIRELEEELGTALYIRHGKRLLGLTETGQEMLNIACRILDEVQNARLLADNFATEQQGILAIGTTHTQARYTLPEIIRRFMETFAGIRIELSQASPRELRQMLLNGEIDLAIASENIAGTAEVAAFPWFDWQHRLLVPRGHPLTLAEEVTLPLLATFPLITYRRGLTGRSRIDQAFLAAGVTPDVILSAQDSDVIETYARLNMGVGIVAETAAPGALDPQLEVLIAPQQFGASTVWMGVKHGQLQRNYLWSFMVMCNPELSAAQLRQQATLEPQNWSDYEI